MNYDLQNSFVMTGYMMIPKFNIEFKVDLEQNILTKYDENGETQYSLKLIAEPVKIPNDLPEVEKAPGLPDVVSFDFEIHK